MLSLSKLALLASGCSEDERDKEVAAINHELSLVEYQQRIPSAAMQVMGSRQCGAGSCMTRSVLVVVEHRALVGTELAVS